MTGEVAPSATRVARVFAAARRSARAPLAWFLLGFLTLYVVTLFPGVGGSVNHGDSAKFQFIGQVLGLSHPPGNPLYILVNALWVRIPSPLRLCTRVSLLSLLFGLGTLLFVYRTLKRLFHERAAMAGGLALGMGPLFWTFSTEAEVYTLNTFLLAAACYHAAVFAESGKERPFLLGAFFYTLGFANHLTSLLLLPAFLGLTLVRIRRGAELRIRDIPIVLGLVAFSASMYLYIPWRFHAGTVYSEFGNRLDATTFWDYVTAKQFQNSFGQFSFVAGVRERMPALLTGIQKQWMWPILLLVPAALRPLRERAPLFLAFLLVAVVSLFFFAFEYDIPDPDGFYTPIVLLLSIGIGAAMTSLEPEWPRASWFGLGMLLTVPFVAHLIVWQHQDANDVVEGVDEGGVVLWDLHDLFARLPYGAIFAVPCSHYGCVEVLNYYRYTSPIVLSHHIDFVRFPNTRPDYWAIHTRLVPVLYETARDRTICSIRKRDADEMRLRHIVVEELTMPTRAVRAGTVRGPTLYCSTGGRSQQGVL